jgi:hypothetical protein
MACHESILLLEHKGSTLSCLFKDIYVAHIVLLEKPSRPCDVFMTSSD